MIKINYSNPISKLQKEYSDIIISKGIDEAGINALLKKINFKSAPLSLNVILTAKFSELLEIADILKKHSTWIRRKRLGLKFDYLKNQEFIAAFFMAQKDIELNSCFYCNIDYINSFIDLKDYENVFDFLNNASFSELCLIKGVRRKKANQIIEFRKSQIIHSINQLIFLNKKSKIHLTTFEFSDTHNHFTLDHVLGQSEYRFFSLSLFNFVPCCSSCNSKFKGAKSFSEINYFKNTSPSSENFSLDKDVKFKVYFPRKLEDISVTNDFRLIPEATSNENAVNEYLSIFKLPGRYTFHKKTVLKLIQNKIDYPDSKLQEIALKTGYSIDKIKSDIFGPELFDPRVTNDPFVKLKRDIAENIGIL